MTLSLSIPFLIAGGVALWPAVGASSSLAGRLSNRELKSRQALLAAALAQLRSLRVQLDDVFKDVDADKDPFMRRVQPQAVLEPAQEFVRLFSLQSQLIVRLERAQSLLRIAFWFLLGFVIVMFAATILGVLIQNVGDIWSSLALIVGAAIFVAGGIVFAAVLLNIRAIDGIHLAVARIERDETSTVSEGELEEVDL